MSQSHFLRRFFLTLCATILPFLGGVGCGSSSSPQTASFTVGGTISGLSGTVVLQNNSGDDLTLSTGDTTFTFSTTVANGAMYEVSVLTQPVGQTCSVAQGNDTINGANITDIVVTCSEDTYTVGGTITGLDGTVVLQNNSEGDITLMTEQAANFVFPTELADGSPFTVIVLTQPAGQTCSVTNGTGTISGANITDVSVVCSVNTFTVGGSITGNSGDVVLQNNSGDDLTLSTNDTTFTFSTSIADGANYEVTILSKPNDQACTVSNDTGTLSGANVTNVLVECSTIPTSGTDISFTDTSNTTLTVVWGAATDADTTTGALEYKAVVSTDVTAIDTLEEADAITGAGLVMDWAAATLMTEATGLTPDTTHFFAVIVRDETGNKSFYTPQSTTTLKGRRIFITVSTFDGNLGGIDGADASCMGDDNKPDSGTYKAMIVDGVNRIACENTSDCTDPDENTDWVMSPNTQYVRLDNTIIGTTNTAGIFESLDLQSLTASFSMVGLDIWTGVQPDWTFDGNGCDQWNSNANGDNANSGLADNVDGSAIADSNQACNTDSIHLACIEQ